MPRPRRQIIRPVAGCPIQGRGQAHRKTGGGLRPRQREEAAGGIGILGQKPLAVIGVLGRDAAGIRLGR